MSIPYLTSNKQLYLLYHSVFIRDAVNLWWIFMLVSENAKQPFCR